jgi:fused signal recognition particle receptor
MFSFFKKKVSVSADVALPVSPPAADADAEAAGSAPEAPEASEARGDAQSRRPWLDRLKHGLRRTGTGITEVFTGTRVDESLYEELEAALLMADTGLPATEHLLADLRQRVKAVKATDPAAVRQLLSSAVAELLAPLQRPLVIGAAQPTVIMVVGVNGAGKTTSIGKLTRHLADSGEKVLLAAADTFRAAAREQLAVWADRALPEAPRPGFMSSRRTGSVDIVSQAGADPAAVVFDAVKAAQARGCQVVIADTAGRLPTQAHLMEELRKIHRTLGKAMGGAPHEVLLVVDGNTGQNALAQVKAFDETLGLTGLVVTKLDGTAKGGVLAAIALWSRQRPGGAVPVYFIGVGEKLEDLETFDAREFAQALLN